MWISPNFFLFFFQNEWEISASGSSLSLSSSWIKRRTYFNDIYNRGKMIESVLQSIICKNRIVFNLRGWCIKNATGTLWHISKMVTPRVKAQASGQNSGSRALKWGIVCLYSSNTFEVMIKTKSIVFLIFFNFCDFV